MIQQIFSEIQQVILLIVRNRLDLEAALEKLSEVIAQIELDVTTAELLPRRILYGSGLLSREKHCQSSLMVEEDTINSFHLSLSALSIGLIDMIKIIRAFIITNHKYK